MRKRSGRPPRFAQVPNETVDDSLNLDLTALGLLTVFLRHKDGWDITLADVGKKYGYGEDAMANAMGMLQCARYVVKVRIMGAGNLWRTEMAVYAPPACDAEVEELLAVIRDEDPEARRVEVIPPTATAIKRVQKRVEKLGRTGGARLRENRDSAPTCGNVASSQVTPDSGVSRDPENPRVPYKTVNQETKGEKELAPPARSAGDVRRTTNGSSACTEDSGCAATEKPSSAGEGGAKRAGGVPVQRAGDRKPSPFRAEIRQAIYATESLLPGPLRAALAEILPHGHLPNVNRLVTAQALETRTPAELGERAARRWISYGYERDHYDGLLRSPLGIVEELLRPTPFCPLPDCEDGRDRHTRMQCSTCEERIEQRKRDRKAGRKVATARPTRLYRDREECDVCSRPLKQGAAPGDVCPPCQAELDQSVALILGGSLPDAPMPDPADAAYAPAPPSSEYREWREQPADDGAPF